MAGAPPSPTLLGQLGELNFRTVHVYGLTETYGPYTVCDWHDGWEDLPADERARLLSRQGQAYVIADPVRVVNDDMTDVPRDGATLGEVAMRGNNVMKGYYDQPDATEEAFRGGWFHSGDIAVMHPDGAIELRDRKKDIIISGGENISTIEVEQAVARHPAVLECAVVAIPDEKWGERPEGLRGAEAGRVGHARGDHRLLPPASRRLQVPGRGGVHRAARRRRPARSRSSSCATRSGPAATGGSTRAVTRRCRALDRLLVGDGDLVGRGGVETEHLAEHGADLFAGTASRWRSWWCRPAFGLGGGGRQEVGAFGQPLHQRDELAEQLVHVGQARRRWCAGPSAHARWRSRPGP